MRNAKILIKDCRSWAQRPGNAWPASGLPDKDLFLMFDRNDNLVDIRYIEWTQEEKDNVDGGAINAMIDDALAEFRRVNYTDMQTFVIRGREL